MNPSPGRIGGRSEFECAASHAVHDSAPNSRASKACRRTSPSTVRQPSGQRERRDGFRFCLSRLMPEYHSQMISTRRLYSFSSGASTRIHACRLLLPESINAATGMPLATTAWYCSSLGIGLPASSRSNSTSTWRNAVTSSFFAPPLVIGLMRRNNPSLVPNTRSTPPFAATLDFHSDAVSVTPRRGTISPSSFSAAGEMATNSSGWKHASMSLTKPSSMVTGSAIVDRSRWTGAGVARRGAGDGAVGNGPDAPSGSLEVRA